VSRIRADHRPLLRAVDLRHRRVDVDVHAGETPTAKSRKAVLGDQLFERRDLGFGESHEIVVDHVDARNDAAREVNEQRIRRERLDTEHAPSPATNASSNRRNWAAIGYTTNAPDFKCPNRSRSARSTPSRRMYAAKPTSPAADVSDASVAFVRPPSGPAAEPDGCQARAGHAALRITIAPGSGPHPGRR